MRKRYVLVSLGLVLLAAPSTFAQGGGTGGYGGPSMLSRGGNRPGHRGRAPMDLTVYGALRGVVETGLTPVRLDDTGQVATENRQGGQVEVGAYGAHNWRRTSLGLDYRGDYRRTVPSTGFDGANQAISLDLMHTLNRRTGIYFRQVGGTSTRAFGGFAAPSVVDPGSFGLVNNELFDTRMYFSQTAVTVGYRASARTSYVADVNGFFVKRSDPRLIGVSGYRASGQLQYRSSARTTIGAQYNFMQFRYPRVYGGSDVQGGALTYRRDVTRNLTLDLLGGALRLIATGTQRVTLSEEVAAILGRSTGVAAFERKSWVPHIAATLNYTLERSRFTGGFITGVDPGNGVFLTTQMQSVQGGYSFTGVRKLSLGVSARGSRYASRSIEIGNMTSYSFGGGATYKLSRIVGLSTQLDYRGFGTTAGLRGRQGFFLSTGLSFSPSSFPVSIW